MATAKAAHKTRITYTLELDEAEVGTLLDVCARIGGDCFRGPRARMDSIGNALTNAGAVRSDHATTSRDGIFYSESNS